MSDSSLTIYWPAEPLAACCQRRHCWLCLCGFLGWPLRVWKWWRWPRWRWWWAVRRQAGSWWQLSPDWQTRGTSCWMHCPTPFVPAAPGRWVAGSEQAEAEPAPAELETLCSSKSSIIYNNWTTPFATLSIDYYVGTTISPLVSDLLIFNVMYSTTNTNFHCHFQPQSNNVYGSC